MTESRPFDWHRCEWEPDGLVCDMATPAYHHPPEPPDWRRRIAFLLFGLVLFGLGFVGIVTATRAYLAFHPFQTTATTGEPHGNCT